MKSPAPTYATFPRPAMLFSEPTASRSAPKPHVILAILSILTVGSHYGRHSLASLGPEIMNTLDISRLKFGVLFSSQALPGIVLPLVGGLALTYVPHGPAAIVLSFCVTCATALCAIAVSRKSYVFLFVGRLLFGLVDGALTTVQGALVARWFRKRAGSSFGCTLFVSRLSSFLGLSLPAYLSQSFGLRAAMWISVFVCIPPFLATIVYTTLASKVDAYQPVTQEDTSSSDDHNATPPSHSVRQLLHSFTTPFWLICYLWIVVAGCVFPVTHFAPDAFSTHFGMPATKAGLLAGAIVLAAGISSPAFGIIQDRYGRRATILAASCAAILFGLVACAWAISSASLLIFTDQELLAAGIILVALGFAAAPVTLLSSVIIVVDDFSVAAALGIYKATENAGLTVLHAVTGASRDGSGSYVQSFLSLAALAGSGVLAAALLGRLSAILRQPAGQSSQPHEVDASQTSDVEAN